ncbi:MAG: 2-dehydro-3-deoxyphosphooctonate aldolase [Candidatus Woesearchaeota archaeon]|nr:2-dehydro-3-deoxyphosphooctonate aldolase [Candidatus Woesearchaeota archaeon]
MENKLAGKKHKSHSTVIKIKDTQIGSNNFTIIAGPCALESEEQIMQIAKTLKKMQVKIIRASAFKPRTSPYSFQGLGREGLKILNKVRQETGLIVETEVMDVRDVKIASENVDILRVGSRNMHNFDLLKELGKVKNPIILKRGLSATIDEFVHAAEYIMASGNKKVILCERGIRTFENAYRNTLDLGAIPVLKSRTHLPVIVDPSHAAGNRKWVPALSKAALAVGADGLLIEMHPDPENAISDGKQSLKPEQLSQLLKELKAIAKPMNKILN